MIKLNRLHQVYAASALFVALAPVPAFGAVCTSDQFANAVDQAGSRLRAYSKQATPKLKAKLEQLRLAQKWPKEGHEERGLKAVHDNKISQYDARVGDYLVNIDTLGREGDKDAPDCATLAALKKASDELLAVMKAKTVYTLARLDEKIAPKAKPTATAPAAKTEGGKQKQSAAKRDDALSPEMLAREAWRTKTKSQLKPNSDGGAAAGRAVGPEVAANIAPAPPQSDRTQQPVLPPEAFSEPDDAYTIDEIRDATRGFFGTISTNLASVIEHAFENWGRPSAYVLGKEGGGAFLAGLRYGNGTLFMRAGGKRKVYWTGPSLGYDFGAEGSRTMFLIYNLDQFEKLFRRYTGVDGSAYLVGGFGITLLKGGPVILAPIRSGIGLRLGANVGYIRFTPEATWNPF